MGGSWKHSNTTDVADVVMVVELVIRSENITKTLIIFSVGIESNGLMLLTLCCMSSFVKFQPRFTVITQPVCNLQ